MTNHKSETKKTLAIWLNLLLTACSPATDQPDSSTASGQVDLLIYNAHVLTLDESNTVTEVIAISDSKIVATGGAGLRKSFTATEEVDLGGRTLIPGFIDSHTHIRGRPPHFIDLTAVTSVAELRELVSAKATQVGPGNWITGYGWSEDEFAEQRRPLITDLDLAAPDNPVIVSFNFLF